MRLVELDIDVELGCDEEVGLTMKINGTPWDELPGIEKEVPERKLQHDVTYRHCAADQRVM